MLALPTASEAQVRTKQPDRQVYRPPRVAPLPTPSGKRKIFTKKEQPSEVRQRRELVDVELDDLGSPSTSRYPEVVRPVDVEVSPQLERVDHEEEVILTAPTLPAPVSEPVGYRKPYYQPVGWIGNLFHSWTCDGCPRCAPACDAIAYDSLGCDSPGCDPLGCATPGCVEPSCDGCVARGCDPLGCATPGCDCMGGDCVASGAPIGCDAIGCDAIGCNCASCQARPWYGKWSLPGLGLSPGDWFGSAELLMVFRRGDTMPPLVTTGPGTDPNTDGELGQPGTRVLVGNDSILKDMQAGARFTFGMWLDQSRSHSLVFRSWFAGDEKYGFNTNQAATPVITRPFLNVTDGQPVAQDTLLVAFPARATGSINVQAESELKGGDIFIRQFWYAQCNYTVDFLYGYQVMRVDERLLVSNTSTSLDASFAPVGAVISVADAFNAQNEFHGAQFGVASRYREGYWSFDAIAKLGFGSLRRRAVRSGVTRTTVGPATSTDPNGLLVRSTNDGTVSDNTFGWAPEIDLSIGWCGYRGWDFTFGYFIVGLTDALRVSGTIDPALASNLADPPTGQQRPSPALRYNSYYAQGLQFGLKYVY